MAKRTYSLDYKVSAAKLVTEQGRGLKDAATSLGVGPSTMRYWVRRFGTPAAQSHAPDDRDALRLENDRLREENRRLLMEREILKEATASAPRSSGEGESLDSKLLIGTLRVTNPAR